MDFLCITIHICLHNFIATVAPPPLIYGKLTQTDRFIAIGTPHDIIMIVDIHVGVNNSFNMGQQNTKTNLCPSCQWYINVFVCFASTINPFQDLMMEFLLLIWSITNTMFDLHEHLKEDACKITALLPPGDQNAK